MIRLLPVTEENREAILSLQVAEHQRTFVADNAQSLLDARIAIDHGGHAFPFGIYDDDTPVGFLMIGFGVDDAWTDAPAIAYGAYNIWRLMIDRRYQHKGYGNAAMTLALQFIRTFPCGPADQVWLSYEPENATARSLYHAFGFRETGNMDGDEIIAAMEL